MRGSGVQIRFAPAASLRIARLSSQPLKLTRLRGFVLVEGHRRKDEFRPISRSSAISLRPWASRIRSQSRPTVRGHSNRCGAPGAGQLSAIDGSTALLPSSYRNITSVRFFLLDVVNIMLKCTWLTLAGHRYPLYSRCRPLSAPENSFR